MFVLLYGSGDSGGRRGARGPVKELRTEERLFPVGKSPEARGLQGVGRSRSAIGEAPGKSRLRVVVIRWGILPSDTLGQPERKGAGEREEVGVWLVKGPVEDRAFLTLRFLLQ